MNKKVSDLRDQIILGMLENLSSTGWTWAAAYDAAQGLGLQEDMLTSLFPDGMCDVVAHFSDLVDRRMQQKLSKVKTDKMRMRDRIELAVMTRFEILEPFQDGLRLAMAYWSVPPRHIKAARIVWRTADRIWDFAGDTSSDYNRYTKRGLLAGILTATALVWLKDQDDDKSMTREFLNRRIENVLQFGQILGKMKPSNRT
jgi:ubiquinone biosynthesis protein COQ9